MQVLLIEDDPHLATFYSRALTRSGFLVTTHARGDEGLRAALSGAFDAVVLDWFLPGMDGIMVVQQMRARGVDTPVLMVSGSGDMVREEAIAAGATAFLGKPCGLKEMTDGVMKMLTSGMMRNLEANAA
jgi:two-component system OmpR family response regulator